jgi:hypothetical protein
MLPRAWRTPTPHTFIPSRSSKSLIVSLIVQGIYYFLTHPALLQPFYSSALTAVIAAAVIVVLICIFGYLPQVHCSRQPKLTQYVGSSIVPFPWASGVHRRNSRRRCRKLDSRKIIRRLVPYQRHDRRRSLRSCIPNPAQTSLTPGSPTTFKRFHSGTKGGHRPPPRHCRPSHQSSTILPTRRNRPIPSHPPSRLYPLHRLGALFVH